MITIGFYSNQLGERGTEIGLYDYAHFNEILLNNKSIIITNKIIDHDIFIKFSKRFSSIIFLKEKSVNQIDKIVNDYKIDLIFFEKSGLIENIEPTLCKSIIHCVFNPSQPHGTIFTVIGKTINTIYKTNFPVLPYIVNVESINTNLRKIFKIPDNAIVFGRYGANDTFDIKFVKDLINNWNKTNTYFLFMNTDKFTDSKYCIFINKNTNLKFKRAFINTCDAFLHARLRGETFGFSIAEFALCNKPIISFAYSVEREHINILGDKIILYKNYNHLKNILENFNPYNFINFYGIDNPYSIYTPNYIMLYFSYLVNKAIHSY